MTKKKSFIMLSSVPLFIIVVIIVVAGYLLLADDLKFPLFDNKPKVRRLQGFPTNVYTDKQLEKERVIIDSEEKLNTFLNKVDSTGMLVVKDKVDFTKEVIIAASSPSRNMEDHELKIKKVYEEPAKNKLIVSIVETFPGEECQMAGDNHISVDIVTINKTDKTIDFEKLTNTKVCKVPKPATPSPSVIPSTN